VVALIVLIAWLTYTAVRIMFNTFIEIIYQVLGGKLDEIRGYLLSNAS